MYRIRTHFKDFIDNIEKEHSPHKDKEIEASVQLLAQYFPKSNEAINIITEFVQHLINDPLLLHCRLTVAFKKNIFIKFKFFSYADNCRI